MLYEAKFQRKLRYPKASERDYRISAFDFRMQFQRKLRYPEASEPSGR